jgi:hypothetical protein
MPWLHGIKDAPKGRMPGGPVPTAVDLVRLVAWEYSGFPNCSAVAGVSQWILNEADAVDLDPGTEQMDTMQSRK